MALWLLPLPCQTDATRLTDYVLLPRDPDPTPPHPTRPPPFPCRPMRPRAPPPRFAAAAHACAATSAHMFVAYPPLPPFLTTTQNLVAATHCFALAHWRVRA